jgi:hypothetical protein
MIREITDEYFVISANEDGEVSVSILSKEVLEKYIGDEWWGKTPFKVLNNKTDFNYDAPAVYIVKGKSILPRAEIIMTRYKVD